MRISDWSSDVCSSDLATLFYPEGQDAPTSRDESIERIKEVLAGVVSVHQGHTPEIEILSPDRATGIWAMEDLLFFPPERARAIGVESSHGYGHYHEDRSEERRVGKECVSTCRSRWSRSH